MNVWREMCLSVLFLAVVDSAAAYAQASVEVNARIQFDFINPGARSLALGGAFTAVADDATAGFTNPAGLMFLSRPEVSIEGRRRRLTTPYTDRGTAPNLVEGESVATIVGASFASVVYPKAKWAVAGYRHELARFESNFESQGAFFTSSTGLESRLFPVTANLELDIINYGISAAVRASQQVAIGAGVSIYDFSLSSQTQRFRPVTFSGPRGPLLNQQLQDGNEVKAGVNLGIVVMPTNTVQFGAVYRQGPDFPFRVRNLGAEGQTFLDTVGTFHVPDVFGAGIVVKPVEGLRIALDYNRIRYSQMVDDFIDVFAPIDPSDYIVDDANEAHVGVEYLFLNMRRPVALRGGFWDDPDHAIRFRRDDPTNQESLLFRGGEDQYHFSGGAGIVLSPRVELNGAVDYSERATLVTLSAVVRF